MTKEMWQLARMHELKDFGERLSHYENDEMLIDEVDEGFCNMMGYTQSELMIRSCGKVGDLIYPPDYEEIRYQIRKNLKQSGSYTCRYRMRKKDGSLILAVPVFIRILRIYRGFAATSLSRQENRNRLITIFVPGILVIRIQDGTGWSADIIRKAKRDASIYVRFWMSRNRNVRCTA